jgi:hypothetical protein
MKADIIKACDKLEKVLRNKTGIIEQLASKFHIGHQAKLKAPFPAGVKLKPSLEGIPSHMYCNLAGSLRNIADSTRPNITYTASMLERFLHCRMKYTRT